jgi:hypothetical protein
MTNHMISKSRDHHSTRLQLTIRGIIKDNPICRKGGLSQSLVAVQLFIYKKKNTDFKLIESRLSFTPLPSLTNRPENVSYPPSTHTKPNERFPRHQATRATSADLLHRSGRRTLPLPLPQLTPRRTQQDLGLSPLSVGSQKRPLHSRHSSLHVRV